MKQGGSYLLAFHKILTNTTQQAGKGKKGG
jgi:hypothetical protein